MSYMVLILQNM
jgi:hypothetical protein